MSGSKKDSIKEASGTARLMGNFKVRVSAAKPVGIVSLMRADGRVESVKVISRKARATPYNKPYPDDSSVQIRKFTADNTIHQYLQAAPYNLESVQIDLPAQKWHQGDHLYNTRKPALTTLEALMEIENQELQRIAQTAFQQARQQALAAGLSVREEINGELVETHADGSQTHLKTLPPPLQVKPGTRKTLPR